MKRNPMLRLSNQNKVIAQKHHNLHILHIVPGLGPGGMELAMARVITALTGQSMRHSIACLKGGPDISEHLPSATDIHCFNARPNEPQLPFRLASLVRKIKPDLIHARNWGAWPDITVGRFFTYPLIPLIYSFHGLGRAGYMPWRRRMASKILVNLTTHLFTVSHQSRDMLVEYWGWPKKRCQVIPNGVDTSRFFPCSRKPNNRIVIGSVGNLRTVKNHALILKACSRLVANGKDLELRIAGEGNQREILTSLSQSLKMRGRFHLLGKTDDVPGFLNKLDIFVLSSDSEQHPNALNEAMACGVASIATQVGCVDDLLDRGRCGRIIQPGDENGLVSALGALVEDEQLRCQIADAGLKHVQTNYSLDVMIQRYKSLYLSAAKKTIL